MKRDTVDLSGLLLFLKVPSMLEGSSHRLGPMDCLLKHRNRFWLVLNM